MNLPAVEAAVVNNALWCDAVCRAHGLSTQMDAALWRCVQPTPRYYPNAVTLDPHAGRAQVAQIGTLVHAAKLTAVSVKDSYAALDLGALGFHLLFEATWIVRAPRAAPVAQPDWRWARVRTPAALAAWESAWRGDEDAPVAATFPPALLHDPGICILLGLRDGKIAGGGILHQTVTPHGAVVGLSNTFARAENEEQVCWPALAAWAARLAPGQPLVGYEAGNTLMQAVDAGFTPLGPLCVWAQH